MTRVLIVDDHGVLRDGLGRVISAQPDMELVGMAANGAEAVELCRGRAPDVVLMDLEMPVMDGIAATRAIHAMSPATAILVLTSFADQQSDHRRARCRRRGVPPQGRLGRGGRAGRPRGGARRLAARPSGGAAAARGARSPRPARRALSPREREVFGLLLEGMPNKLIARQLGISEKTVKSHLTNVFRAIGVTDRVQAILWAERQGVRGDLSALVGARIDTGTKVPLRQGAVARTLMA